MFLGRLDTKDIASSLRQPVILCQFYLLLTRGKSPANHILSCVPLSIALLLFLAHREEGDKDDSSADDNNKCSPVLSGPWFDISLLIGSLMS